MFDQETSISAAQALEYRLPANVTPERYDLSLTPDLKAFTFAGHETVAITVHDATTEVVLNALELEIESAVADHAGKSLTAQIDPEPARERVASALRRTTQRRRVDAAHQVSRYPQRQAARLLSQSVHGRRR